MISPSAFPLPPSPLNIVTALAPEPVARVAVIGGGITGLTAAHRVQELLPRCELALFEASPRLGGVLETVYLDGFLIERSADSFLAKLPAAVELCRRLGIADELISTDESRRRAFVVRGGQLLPIPEGFFLMAPRKLAPIFASPLLSVPGKLRLLAEPLVARRTDSQSDESVASFARRRLGCEVFERLVQPLVAGIYTADPSKLSMAATMPDFLQQEIEHGSLLRAARKNDCETERSADAASGARYGLFAAPKDGMAALVDAIADRLPAAAVILNTQVERIERTPDSHWRLNFVLERAGSSSTPPGAEDRPARSKLRTFDAIILAVPTHAAARLLAPCDPELASELSTIEYASCAVVSLGYKRKQIGHALDGFGFVVPQVEGRRIIAGSFASQKFSGRAPDDSVLIRVFIGGALQPELLKLFDAELRRIAAEELSDLLQITGEPIVADVSRWPNSMPQYHVGHLGRVARIEQLVGRHSGLFLAGNAYHGVGVPQCIASGETAAEAVATHVLAQSKG